MIIGINYTDNNVWAEKASWEFANGFRIMDFHFNKWASTYVMNVIDIQSYLRKRALNCILVIDIIFLSSVITVKQDYVLKPRSIIQK